MGQYADLFEVAPPVATSGKYADLFEPDAAPARSGKYADLFEADVPPNDSPPADRDASGNVISHDQQLVAPPVPGLDLAGENAIRAKLGYSQLPPEGSPDYIAEMRRALNPQNLPEPPDPATYREAYKEGGATGVALFPHKVSSLFPDLPEAKSGPERVIRSALQFPGQAADFLTSPEGVALAAGTAVSGPVALASELGFSADMIRNLTESKSLEEAMGNILGLATIGGGVAHSNVKLAKELHKGTVEAPTAPPERPSAPSAPEAPARPDQRPVNAELDAMANELRAKMAQETPVGTPDSGNGNAPVPATERIARDDFGGETTPVSAAIINDLGGIMSRSTATRTGQYKTAPELWDGSPALAHPTHNKIFNPKGQMPDAAAAELYDMGLIREPTPDAMYQAIVQESQSAANALKRQREQSVQAAQAENQQRAADVQAKASASKFNKEAGQQPLQPPEGSAKIPSQDEFARELPSQQAGGAENVSGQQRQAADTGKPGVGLPENPGVGGERGRAAESGSAGTSNRVNTATYGEEAVPSGQGVDTTELLDNARASLRSGAVDPYAVLSRTRANGIANAEEYAALAAEHERLVNDAVAKQKANDPTAPEAAKAAEDFANAIQPHKTAASDLMRLFQGDINYDLSTPFGMNEYMKAELGRGMKPSEAPKFEHHSRNIRQAESNAQQAVGRANARVRQRYAKVRDIPIEEAAARVKSWLKDCVV